MPRAIASTEERSPSISSHAERRAARRPSPGRAPAPPPRRRARRSRRATCPPMNPVAPVTNAFMAGLYGLTPHAAYTQGNGADGSTGIRNPRARQRALLIAAGPDEPDLAELGELLRTAGVAVAGEMTQKRPAPDPDRYFGKGKLAELKRAIKASDANLVAVRRRAAAAPGAQPRGGARTAGDRPHRDDPRHLRRPRRARPRASSRSSWPSSSTTSPACAGCGPTSSGWAAPPAAASARGARARPRSRPTAASRATASPRCAGGWSTPRARARRCATSASGPACPPWRWPATPTPASPRC